MNVYEVRDPAIKRSIAASVLADLPEWFGIPESTAEYVRESADMPFFALCAQGDHAGFIALKETSPVTAEIYVMGVKKRLHHTGAGTMLFHAFCAYALQHGYQYAQVKTVAAGYYAEYDATRLFYEHLGFCPLEVFPTLWDEWNPCLVMVMKLQQMHST